jgi:uncharacterized membrane protein YkvA (DUF1232 family)
MPLDITFHLNDSDLEHFREVMTRAREAGRDRSPEDIVKHAGALITKVNASDAAEFIRERMDTLDILIAMVLDKGWELEEEDRERVVEALSYFAEAEDLIPDDIPGLGFLDDAIMIELVAQDLTHEIQAYRDFVVYRAAESCRRGDAAESLERADWLAERRKQLQSRMRRRRRRGGGSGGGRSPFSMI